VVGVTRDIPVEALFPYGGGCFELGSSGWSWILGTDAVGGPPYCNVADEGGARVTSWCSPYWGRANLVGMILDLVGEVGEQLGSLCQVGPPARMATKRFWNAGSQGSGFDLTFSPGEVSLDPVGSGRSMAPST
jgi:hypothetical protein